MINIPAVKVIFSGDREQSKKLRGNANRIMHILEGMMTLRGLDQLSVTVEPYPGAEIKCSKVFGRRTINIYTPPTGGGEAWKERKCVCNCNFSEGYILKIEDENIDKDTDDVTPLYTIMACVSRGKRYKMFQHVLASDFTKYKVGQKILLVPYEKMAFLCCDDVALPANGCKPKTSEEEISNEKWRTTYRIIPWCALLVPRWYKIRGSQNGDVR